MALVGCATRAPDVSVWSLQSPHLGLPTTKTYAFSKSTGPIQDPTRVWAPPGFDLEAALRPLVEAELADRDYALASEAPWVTISYEILADQAQVDSAAKRLGELKTAKPIGIGTLILDIDDPASGRVLWRGAAVGGVNAGRSLDEIDERLHYAIEEIFRGFPE
ncbi:MAG: DUF4136 domain-containing protein [Deltaproteobacteria bacterium]|nr:DUF4136 domain-containing protein [Deltaproteobacteria bacterium]